jgi:hypothetical protein
MLASLYGPDYPKFADVFIGGEALRLSQNVVLLLEGGNLSVTMVFSYRLQKERRFIECAFGIAGKK